MLSRADRVRNAVPWTLAMAALTAAGLLFVWEAFPWLLSTQVHDFLGALPLILIAVAYLFHQRVRRPGPGELVKALLLAAAFLFWAATQLWPNLPVAALFNDLAIALFVLDVFLVIVGWPRHAHPLAFAETYLEEGEALDGSDVARFEGERRG